jgi:NADPH:quinone reductase-like Zn-dependent oxidoreductase
MRALLLDKPGFGFTLRIGELPCPEPAVGEVRVRVRAVSLNPVDYKFAETGHNDWTLPHVLGLDIAGSIDAVGDGVTGWREGDRAVWFGNPWRSGGFADYAIAPAQVLARIPDRVSYETAAALPTAGLTAYEIFYRKAVHRPGQTALIYGATGGVGSFAVQLAKLVGWKVIAVTSASKSKIAYELGADHVVRLDEDIGEALRRVNDGRLGDLVVDTIGSDNATKTLDLLRFNGALICVVGFPDFAALNWFERGISIHEVALAAAYRAGDDANIADLSTMLTELLQLVGQRQVTPLIAETIAFEQIPNALERLRRRSVPPGKIVARLVDGVSR